MTGMLFQVKVIVFVAASSAIAWVSWPALRNFRSHGFYRFFAWEAILVLILLNLDNWVTEPLAAHQLLSWFLLLVSLFLALHGFRLLRMLGKPDSGRADPALLGLEKTTALVTAGAYRYIRHPLYSSLLFLAWGAFFKAPAWLGLVLAGLATFFLTMTARIEEGENIRFFGPAYHEYMTQTRMFIPFLF